MAIKFWILILTILDQFEQFNSSESCSNIDPTQIDQYQWKLKNNHQNGNLFMITIYFVFSFEIFQFFCFSFFISI